MRGGEIRLPDWMTRPADIGPLPPGGAGSTRFLRRTLARVNEVFQTDFFGEKYTARPGLLQPIHPGVKLAVLLGYAVLAGLLPDIPSLLMAAMVPIVYAGLSGVPVKMFIRRAWAVLPVLLLVLSLPGAVNLFSRGPALVPLLPRGTAGLAGGLYLTAPGLLGALRVALRGGISLSCALLLLLTTRWADVTAGFAALHLPRLFQSVLNMAYRYLFVLSGMAAEMMEARELRTVGRLTGRENRRFVGRSAGALFLRAHALSGEIYDAMRCRGYDGGTWPGASRRVQAADRLFAAGNAALMILLAAWGILF